MKLCKIYLKLLIYKLGSKQPVSDHTFVND